MSVHLIGRATLLPRVPRGDPASVRYVNAPSGGEVEVDDRRRAWLQAGGSRNWFTVILPCIDAVAPGCVDGTPSPLMARPTTMPRSPLKVLDRSLLP